MGLITPSTNDSLPLRQENLVATFVHSVARNAFAAASSLQSVPVPVETAVVVGVSLRSEQVSEHAAQVSNVWLGFELQAAAVRKVLGELAGAALAESGDRDRLFLFHDKLVLFGGGFGLETLPGQSSLEEIDQNVSDRFQIISARLLHAQVIVDGGVTGRTRQ